MKKIIHFMICTLLIGGAYADGSTEVHKQVLEELLAERLITQLDHDKKQAELSHIKSRNMQQTKRPINLEMQAQKGGTATISGTVQSGGMDLEAISIVLYDATTRAFMGAESTDQFGSYSFTGLSAGDYFAVANNDSDEYINVMWSSVGMVVCSYCQPDGDSTISVADAGSQNGIDFNLTVGAQVNGQITDGSAAVAGEYVTIRGIAPTEYHASQITDISGNYSFNGLPAGSYYVTKMHPSDIYVDAMWASSGTVNCFDCQPDVDSTLVLAAAEVRNGVDMVLTIGASISGDLVDDVTLLQVDTLGVRVVDVDDIYSNWYFMAELDGSGVYTVSGLPTGNYKVYLEPYIEMENRHIPEIYNNIQCNACSTMIYDGAGDALALVNGVHTANIDFHVSVGASISGILLNNDHPTETLAEIGLVYLFNDANRVLAYRYLYGTNSNPSFDGTYTIGGLLPGTYFVQGGDLGREFFQRELFENIACPWSGCDRGAGGTPVVLGANEQRLGVNFFLNYGGKISGTVTDASTGLPINSPTTQYIQFYNSEGEVAGGAGINPDGTYIAQRALPPGTYSVRTGSMFIGEFNSPYVMEKYMPGPNMDCPGVSCDLTAGNVTVEAYVRLDPRDPVAEASNATVTGIDFALSPGFSFSGTITELGSSTPIPDVHVLVYNDLGAFAQWATTDASGDFTVHGLPAGTYYALTNNGSNLPFMGLNQTVSGGWIDILFDGTACPGSACDVTTGDPIVLGGPSNGFKGVQTFDFGLNAGGTISGQVRNFADQLPASAVSVNVFNDQGAYFGSYQTDNSGHYMTVGFPAGTYYMTTSNNGALLDAKFGGDYCLDESCDPLDGTPVVIVGDESLVNKDFNLKPDYIFKSGLE